MGRKNIAIVGAGAVGCCFAQQFHQANQDNFFIAADGDRYQSLVENGLVFNDQTLHMEVISPSASDEYMDIIILVVKDTHLTDTLEMIRPIVNDRTIILSLLNGIDSEEQIGRAFSPEQVLYGFVVNIDATRIGNRITSNLKGKIIFGEAENHSLSEQVLAVKQALERAGIDYDIPADMMHAMWWKFMINVSINSLSAILRAPYRVFQHDERARSLMLQAIDEVIQIAAAEGITLTQEDIDRWFSILAPLNPEAKTSMLQDIEAGRKTEIQLFSGKVCHYGKKHGIATPVNETLLRMVEIIEDNNQAP